MKRKTIVDNIKTRLSGITTANGYYTNAGNAVYEWRVASFEENEPVGINVRDTTDEVYDFTQESIHSMPAYHTMTVELDLLTMSVTTGSMDTLRQLVADVEKAIKVDETWSGYALRTVPVKNEIIVDQDEARVLGAVYTMTVDYRTGKFAED